MKKTAERLTDALPWGGIASLAGKFNTSGTLISKVLNGEINKSKVLDTAKVLEAAEELILQEQATTLENERRRSRILKASKL